MHEHPLAKKKSSQQTGSGRKIHSAPPGRNHERKEKIMVAQEVLKMQESLAEIDKNVSALMNAVLASSPMVREKLVKIWDVTQGLQRRLSQPDLLTGYKNDAIDQAARVADLLFECEMNPDDDQLASIGYACDLAQTKIKTYQQVKGHAARIELVTGMAATEEA